MRKLHLLVAILVLSGMVANAQRLVFSYFKDNGQDGLHLAVSEGGYEWMAVNHDRSILKPTVGKEKLMRPLHRERYARRLVSHGVDGWLERTRYRIRQLQRSHQLVGAKAVACYGT